MKNVTFVVMNMISVVGCITFEWTIIQYYYYYNGLFLPLYPVLIQYSNIIKISCIQKKLIENLSQPINIT